MTRLIALESIRERGLRQGIMIQSHPSHISPHHHPSLTEWLGSNLEPSSELFVQEVIHQTQGWLVVTWGYLNRSIPTNYWYQRPTFQVISYNSFLWLTQCSGMCNIKIKVFWIENCWIEHNSWVYHFKWVSTNKKLIYE